MKVERPSPDQEFTPITVSVTFETANELRNLWHRVNMSWPNVVNRTSETVMDIPRQDACANVLFAVLDDVAIERGLRKR